MMRFVVARRLGLRGEGLGNEMIAWSKGFIASRALDAKLVGPSWGLNRRKYYRNFSTSRLDFVIEELLTRLPHYTFTEADYITSGQVDFGSAIAIWASRKGITEKNAYVVTVDGMYGGYRAIHEARPFLWAQLLNSRDALDNIYRISSQLDSHKLFVAVHMRFGGDFAKLTDEQPARGRFNVRIPLSWYTHICEALRVAFKGRIQFHFFTDRGGAEFDDTVHSFNPGQTRQAGLTECSDLALMAQADLRICSISSYSLVASFLANGLYAWYEPQLTYESGSYTLWGGEKGQQSPESMTNRALERAQRFTPGSGQENCLRGYPIKVNGVLPQSLVSQLSRILMVKDPTCNLLEHGVVPDWFF